MQTPEPTLAERFTDLLSDPLFWFSAVLLGLVVGVAGNFATDWLKGLLSQRSVKSKRKKKSQIEAEQEFVRGLKDKPQDLYVFFLLYISLQVLAVGALVLIAFISIGAALYRSSVPLFSPLLLYVPSVIVAVFIISALIASFNYLLNTTRRIRNFDKYMLETQAQIDKLQAIEDAKQKA